MGDKGIIQLGGAAPSPDLLPAKMITRAARAAINTDMSGTLSYGNPKGIPALRRQIAKKMIGAAGNLTADQIIVTNGCTDAISLCLRAVARPGDTLAVDSPTCFGFLQLFEDMKLKALELPTHPVEGIDLDSLQRAIKSHKIRALLSIPNVNNPLGYVMPVDHKRRMAEMLQTHHIPIIEDGIYSDLSFEDEASPTLKAFDRKGLVLYCSSLSKTLAPGLRIGWTAPGKFLNQIQRLKRNSTIISPALNQQIAAECLKTGFYDRHVRIMKNALKVRISKMASAIANYFPPDTKITTPAGGFLLWVQLHPAIDGFKVYKKALERKIATLPGFLCSSSGRYRNCIRLNCGFPWDAKMENAIATLGRVIKEMV
jgi:DNA-binding transcriptional MocR family regulator